MIQLALNPRYGASCRRILAIAALTAGVLAGPAMAQQRTDLSGANCTAANLGQVQHEIANEGMRKLEANQMSEEAFFNMTSNIPLVIKDWPTTPQAMKRMCEAMMEYRARHLDGPADGPAKAQPKPEAAQPKARQGSLRADLEAAVKAHRAAAASGDLDRFQQTMASSAFGRLAKQAGKSGAGLTGNDIKRFAGKIPDVSKLAYHKVFETGPTAALVYKDGSGNQSDAAFMFIKLVKEGGRWRYYRSVRIHSSTHGGGAEENEFQLSDLDAFRSMGITDFDIDGKVAR